MGQMRSEGEKSRMTTRFTARMGLPFTEIWKNTKRAALGRKVKNSVWDTLTPRCTSNTFKNRTHFENVPVNIRKL